jgi:hypothetical protein
MDTEFPEISTFRWQSDRLTSAAVQTAIAGLAQLVEQFICNDQVVGSSPTVGSMAFQKLETQTTFEPAMQRAAFEMRLKPGFESEYRRRHDEIWPELSRALTDAGVSDYSIFLDPETLILFAVQKLAEGAQRGQTARSPGRPQVVAAHGRHHGDQSG